MKKWEYKTIYRSREWESLGASQFNLSSWNRHIEDELSELGEQGWELISVTNDLGTPMANQPPLVTGQMWIFKRPGNAAGKVEDST